MIRKLASKCRSYLQKQLLQKPSGIFARWPCADQKVLSVLYQQHYHAKCPPLSFKDVGFRVNSQNEEDGILLFIFSLVGTTTKRCVEMCAGDGIECNTANLIINHRWTGILFDGNERNIEKARQFYSTNQDTKYWPPTIIKQWITQSRVNSLILANGFSGQIDLLSLDMDGVDYWVWKEISCIAPRVVVLEFNHLWGPNPSVTVPYRDDFIAEYSQFGSDYAGASLQAFVKLNRQKGYRLVGTNAIGTNAFFVRNDIPCDWLPEIDVSTCFDHPRVQFGMKYRLPGVRCKAWVEV